MKYYDGVDVPRYCPCCSSIIDNYSLGWICSGYFEICKFCKFSIAVNSCNLFCSVFDDGFSVSTAEFLLRR